MPAGEGATGIVAITVLFKAFITETELEPLLNTYTKLPSGLVTIWPGPFPTVIVVITELVAVLITQI